MTAKMGTLMRSFNPLLKAQYNSTVVKIYIPKLDLIVKQ